MGYCGRDECGPYGRVYAGRLIYHDHTSEVSALAWSPDSMRLASGSADKTVQIWNATTGQTMFTYRGQFGTVTALAWSPNGKLIASGSEDTTVQVWYTV